MALPRCLGDLLGNPRRQEELQALVQAEHAELRRFINQHPCPTEADVRPWLHQRRLACLLQRAVPDARLETFDYNCFKQLWEAPSKDPEEAKRLQRTAGETINVAGGIAAMRLHFYALHYALCSGRFVDREQVPMSVFGYARQLEHVWDGIGTWQA